MKFAKLGLFAAGVLFGTAGIKILSSKDAKKAYTHATAAALRAKESVMTTVTTIKENADDILADAKEINEQRAVKDEIIEDTNVSDDTAEADSTEDISTNYVKDAPSEAVTDTVEE